MDSSIRVSLISLLWAVLSLATSASAQMAQPQPTPGPPLAVSSPANLNQLPPSAPTVTYQNGVLTISAYNSTLRDILQGIRSQTGADLNIPPQADERVVTNLGPGPAREVIRSLLAGSRFDYVIVGSYADPDAVVKLLLFPKPATENASQTPVNAANTAPQPRFDRDESTIVAEGVQPEGNSQEPELPVRAWQKLLQQRRQLVMEEFQQNRAPE
jgi:hypothetical protein